MDRETLNIFLQSGPARKYNIASFTSIIKRSADDKVFLFKNPALNKSIFFKCMVVDEYDHISTERPISTLIYLPYDLNKPNEGGESFIFHEQTFARYCSQMARGTDDLAAIEYDQELIRILDSLPTFSPLIVELALERNNLSIPLTYLDLTPELRTKLRAQLKGRIRPLIVAAYGKGSASVEKAVDDMTTKLFTLHDVREILPLVEALRLPPENAVEFLSSWIGITYFEYEYSMLQNHLKEFALWIARWSEYTGNLSSKDKDYIDGLADQIKARLSEDWKQIFVLSEEYKESYSNLVYNSAIAQFSGFLCRCKDAYWELGDLLGRFEQTAIAWRLFRNGFDGKPIPFPVIAKFFSLLRKLHAAPPRVSVDELPDRANDATGFPNFAPNLF